MKPLYYKAEDVAILTGYGIDKSYKLISQWNREIEEKYRDEDGNPLKTYKGRVAIWYFNQVQGIKENIKRRS